MHPVDLPQDMLDQLVARRGRLRVFDRLAPRSTALLVIDMQNAFVASTGFAYVPTAAGIVPNINRLAAAVRQANGLVVWIRVTLTAEGRSAWDTFFENFFLDGLGAGCRAELMPGHESYAFCPDLEIDDIDLISDKDRFSAFIQGASNLEGELRERNIDTVLVTGTATNVCCESTARDAMMRDFRVFMIADANAARTDEDHIAGLRTIVQVFGDVIATDEAIELIHSASAV